MATTVFLQKFVNGDETAVPFHSVSEFLAQYGKLGRGGNGHLEVTFAPDKIADVANVVGDELSGIKCLGMERPVFDDSFRVFAFEAMDKFGFSCFDDALESVYVLHGTTNDIPERIRNESENGVERISNFRQIWPPKP